MLKSNISCLNGLDVYKLTWLFSSMKPSFVVTSTQIYNIKMNSSINITKYMSTIIR